MRPLLTGISSNSANALHSPLRPAEPHGRVGIGIDLPVPAVCRAQGDLALAPVFHDELATALPERAPDQSSVESSASEQRRNLPVRASQGKGVGQGLRQLRVVDLVQTDEAIAHVLQLRNEVLGQRECLVPGSDRVHVGHAVVHHDDAPAFLLDGVEIGLGRLFHGFAEPPVVAIDAVDVPVDGPHVTVRTADVDVQFFRHLGRPLPIGGPEVDGLSLVVLLESACSFESPGPGTSPSMET